MAAMRYLHLLLFLVMSLVPASWAQAGSCQAQGQAVATPHLSVAAPHAVAAVLFAPDDDGARMPQWEFAPDEELDIVEQFSQPDWSDVQIDRLSCRAVDDDDSPLPLPAPEGHECDFPALRWVADPGLGQALFPAPQHPPLPAPVFPFLRPPAAA